MPVAVRHWWINRKNREEKEKKEKTGNAPPPKDPWGNVKK